jgi:hypothetical protein
MLVCFVSALAQRRPVAADVVEAAAAVDEPGTGNVVFATLVDDPASVRDIVDAYNGEIMVEPASAGDTVDVALIYEVAILEEVVAADTSSSSIYVPGVVTADLAEPAAADAAQDGTVVAVVRSAMLPGVFINSGTARQACVDGVMVNL